MRGKGQGTSFPGWLQGSIPDMTALTATYLELQRLYRDKAEQDLAALEAHVCQVCTSTISLCPLAVAWLPRAIFWMGMSGRVIAAPQHSKTGDGGDGASKFACPGLIMGLPSCNVSTLR